MDASFVSSVRPVRPLRLLRSRWREAAERALPLLALAGALLTFAAMSQAPEAADAQQAAPHDLAAMADRLSARLESTPADASGWALLARSHVALGDHARADAAYARALALDERDAQLWAERAQVQVLRGAGASSDRVQALARRALEIDATHALALALQGDAAYERGEFGPARARWSTARQHAAAADTELAVALDRRLAMLDDAQRALGTTASGTAAR